MRSLVTIEGVVTGSAWPDPHVCVTLGAADEQGWTRDWTVQMGSTITVARMGWDRDSLTAGERVTIRTHAAVDGRSYGLSNSIVKADGVRLPTAFERSSGEPLLRVAEPAVGASSGEGRWIAASAKLVSHPGGIDGFFRARLTLTDKAQAQAAQAALDELTVDNPEATRIGRPTPGMIVSTNLFPLEIGFVSEDIIVIRSEYFDDERTVHMDGCGHPASTKRSVGGHSAGQWEGDTLVVDTTDFVDQRSPYQSGVPSGAHKHVAEQHRVLEGGKRMMVELVLEDSEYIVSVMNQSRELVYSPQMQMSRFDSDAELTRRFVPE